MNVVLVNTARGWRGGERQTLYLAQGLLQAGVEVRCIARKHQPLSQKLSALEIPVHEVDNPIRLVLATRSLCTTDTVISVQNGSAMSQLGAASFLIPQPLVYSQRMHITKQVLSSKYAKAAAVTTVSNSVAQDLHARGCNNVVVIPDACVARQLNTHRAHDIVRALGVSSTIVLGTTSALTAPKDPLTLVRAFAEFTKHYPEAVFIHCGEGAERTNVEAEILRLGLQHKYILAGMIEQVEDLFSIFTQYVHSAKEEAFGSSVLDAFLYKVPVVSTAAGGLVEAVLGRGLLSQPENPTALAGNMLRMFREYELRAQCIENAHVAATTTYSIPVTTEQYLQVFTSVV